MMSNIPVRALTVFAMCHCANALVNPWEQFSTSSAHVVSKKHTLPFES